MIIAPTHTEIEVRVLAAVFSCPSALSLIPKLEVRDLDLLVHRVLFSALRNIEAGAGIPGSTAELRLSVADLLISGAVARGASDGSFYHRLAGQLTGRQEKDSSIRIDIRILSGRDASLTPSLRDQVQSDARRLQFARRARDQMFATQLECAGKR